MSDGIVVLDKITKAFIHDKNDSKVIISPDFNHVFDKNTGQAITYGRTKDDNPEYCKYGPLIVDFEITTICSGVRGKLCDFCYKTNNPFGRNTSFFTFKTVFDKLPKTVTQIAFGVDASCTSNPDIWDILKYSRQNGVIPNITVADITQDTAEKISNVCGAVAVSRYDNKDVCYDSIKLLTDTGMNQVNMHICIHNDNFDQIKETLHDIIVAKDPRLEKLNAIVFLSLKQKGRGAGFSPLEQDKFTEIVDTCLSYGVNFGFDSCSAIKFMVAIKGHENEKQMIDLTEPCESTKFSAYINVDGVFFPCSFVEGVGEWEEGLDVITCTDFLKDVWYSRKTINFRNACTDCFNNGISCQVFNI